MIYLALFALFLWNVNLQLRVRQLDRFVNNLVNAHNQVAVKLSEITEPLK